MRVECSSPPHASPFRTSQQESWNQFREPFSKLVALDVLAAAMPQPEHAASGSVASEASTRDSSKAPLLAIQLLVVPLAKRFRHHFMGSRSTARADKPEWFFSYALDIIAYVVATPCGGICSSVVALSLTRATAAAAAALAVCFEQRSRRVPDAPCAATDCTPLCNRGCPGISSRVAAVPRCCVFLVQHLTLSPSPSFPCAYSLNSFTAWCAQCRSAWSS